MVMNRKELRLSSSNNLESCYPGIAARWHPTKTGSSNPSMICPRSKKDVWWLCKNGHEHKSAIGNMVAAFKRGSVSAGCPYCSGDRATRENNLAMLFPDLIVEWNVDKNVEIYPCNVTPQSHIRAWWKCKMGHEWISTVQDRTAKKSGCPKCRLFGSSRFEARVFSEINYLWPDSESKKRISGKECDIFIPSLGVIIEVDGFWWHKDARNRDKRKTEFLKKNGYRVVRMRQSPLPTITEDDICFEEGAYRTDSNALDCIKDLVLKLGRWSRKDVSEYISRREFVNDDGYRDILRFFPLPKNGESLADRFPEISRQWHPAKNEGNSPKYLRPKSNKKVWWICNKGHEWQASPLNRTYGRGCPYCATGHKICADNSLVTTTPDVARQWHPEKNGNLDPNKIGRGSTEKVWWICDRGHEWQSVVKERCRGRKVGCPACARILHSERMKGNDFRNRGCKARMSATA